MPTGSAYSADWSALRLGAYAERRQTAIHALDQAILGALEAGRSRLAGVRFLHRRIVNRIESFAPRMRAMNDDELKAYAAALRPRLLRQGVSGGPVAECFALIRETTERKIGLRHYRFN